jgi:TatD DNase family protein
VIDTHVHYDHKRFHKYRRNLLSSFAEAGIRAVINPAISFASNHDMREILEEYPWIYYGAGIHPNWGSQTVADEDDNRLQQLRIFAGDSRTVAIGETGLDYARAAQPDLQKRQRIWFHRQIAVAEELKLR